MTSQPETPAPPKTEEKSAKKINLRVFQEYFNALIAFLIVAAFLLMAAFTIPVAITGTDDSFNRVKDLLLLINPLVGVVIGYYFNKATSDARAESAENNAKAANENAQQATRERDNAVTQAQSAQAEAAEMKGALHEISTAAKEVLQDAGDGEEAVGLGVLRSAKGATSTERASIAHLRLREALRRARRFRD